MKKLFVLVVMSFVLVFAHSAFASQAQSAHGQTVYVAASWRNITSLNQLTSSSLVIRNMDSTKTLTILILLFYGADGQIKRNLLDGQFGGPTSITLGPHQSTSITTNTTTTGINRDDESELGRPFWIVEWRSTAVWPNGRTYSPDMIAPMIGGSMQILTPVSIFGSIGPNYIIQSLANTEGVVLLQH